VESGKTDFPLSPGMVSEAEFALKITPNAMKKVTIFLGFQFMLE